MIRRILARSSAAVALLLSVGFAVAAALTTKSPEPDVERAYRGQPVELGRDAPLVGSLIHDARWTASDERAASLSTVAGPAGLVVVLRDPGCPVAGRYGPAVARLEGEYTERGFGFLYVYPSGSDPKAVRRDVDTQGYAAPWVVDTDGGIVGALAARLSTEVFVLDRARTLVYRGAIDDQYGIGYSRPAPERTYLRDALDAVLAGDSPPVVATMAPGCFLAEKGTSPPARDVTYHNRISRILQDRCQSCHRSGSVGPFPLTSYREAFGRRQTIAFAVEEKIMPPFYVDAGYGPWSNDLSLTDSERADLLAWIEDGAPEGDPNDGPVTRTFVDGWTIGEPDLVIPMPEAFEVPAEGTVDYQYFYARTELPEDRWIRAMEIRSTAPGVVHHVLVFVESPEILEKMRERRREVSNPRRDPEYRKLRRQFQTGVRSYLASAVPGQTGIRFPEGLGKKLPAGAWLKFQVHYTPNGEKATDRSEIGFVFADEPIHTEVRTSSAINADFEIPAGSRNYRVDAEYTFEEPVALLSLFPHTHLRGTRFQFDLAYPDGRVETLLPLTRYDFNWQLNYLLRTPLEIPAGTTVKASAWYDNSAANPANPDPTVAVRFGEQTWDEMMIGYFNWVPRDAGAP